jgi:gluconolactonase
MTPEVVASGIGFGEGPVWRSRQGDLVVTSISEGWLFRIDVGTGAVERFADTAGGPNGALLLDDGGILVAQNGGLDVSRWSRDPPPPVRPVAPGLQVASPDGAVRSLAGEGKLTSPNDLAVDIDGSVVFTDVIHSPDWTQLSGRLWRLYADGAIILIEEVPHYLNGVSAGPNGLLTAEATGLRWLRGGDRDWLSPDCGPVDGFALDAAGRAYACVPGRALVVVDADGRLVEELSLPEGHFVTNCCFGGSALDTLFVTDAGNGTVLAFENMPTAGHPLIPFVLSDRQ